MRGVQRGGVILFGERLLGDFQLILRARTLPPAGFAVVS